MDKPPQGSVKAWKVAILLTCIVVSMACFAATRAPMCNSIDLDIRERLQRLRDAPSISKDLLLYEVKEIEEALLRRKTCSMEAYVIESRPSGVSKDINSRKPSPEEMMERTLKTHKPYKPTSDLPNDSKLGVLIDKIRLLAAHAPVDVQAVRDAINEYFK
jgi:hypothetical protein